MKRTLENDDEGAGYPCRGLFFSDRIRSKPIAQKRQEAAAARSGNAESANGLQARWNGQRDQALGRRLHGCGGT
jgi:hypothetical protein